MTLFLTNSKKGQKLPSVRELALIMKVNPNTMQKALVELEDEKLIYTERTNGKFVTRDEKLIEQTKKQLTQEKVDNYLNSMNNIGISYELAVKYLQELGGKNEIKRFKDRTKFNGCVCRRKSSKK